MVWIKQLKVVGVLMVLAGIVTELVKRLLRIRYYPKF